MIWLALFFFCGFLFGILLLSWLPNAWRGWREKRRLKQFKLTLLQAHQLRVSAVEVAAVAAPELVETSAAPKAAHQPLTLALEDLPPAKPHKKRLLDDENTSFEPALTLVDFELTVSTQHFQIKKQGDTF